MNTKLLLLLLLGMMATNVYSGASSCRKKLPKLPKSKGFYLDISFLLLFVNNFFFQSYR